MSSPEYRVRRATVDDLPILQALWVQMRLPVVDLEKRPTEFQVAESADGILLGAVAMEISGRAGRIHSEAYHDFALSEILRQHLWERLQSLAANHGLARLWTRETAPFWSRNGFHAPDDAELAKLPPAWGRDLPGWLTLQLRDEEALEMALEKEFTRFKLEEKRRMEKVLRQGKILNFIGTALAILLFIGVMTFAFFWVLRFHPHLLGR
jgi:N-acetylglutamate synthase-like GNAT family acetyltransferase